MRLWQPERVLIYPPKNMSTGWMLIFHMSRLNDQAERREIGMAIPWPLMRLVQAIVTLGLAGMGALMPISVPLKALYFGAVITVSIGVGHPFARVVADDRGLYVTRYMQTHFLEWREVISARMSWREGGIKIDFHRSIGGLRYAIVNLPDMPVGRAFFVLIKKEEPEVVFWIRERIRAARPGSL
jgi:hypothetical protein